MSKQHCISLTIRALVMGDWVPCYGVLEIVGLLLLLLLLSIPGTVFMVFQSDKVITCIRPLHLLTVLYCYSVRQLFIFGRIITNGGE